MEGVRTVYRMFKHMLGNKQNLSASTDNNNEIQTPKSHPGTYLSIPIPKATVAHKTLIRPTLHCLWRRSRSCASSSAW